MNFIFDKNTDNYISRYKMRTDDGRLLESRQNIIVVELPKIAKLEKTSVNHLTSIEKWCKFLLDADDSEKLGYIGEIASSEEGIMSAQDMLWDLNKNYSMWTAEEAYNNEIRWREMEKRENARILEESVAVATQQGIAQGAHDARIETARTALLMGMTHEVVAKISGLPLEEIQQLAEES